jgi:aryl-alcohol dehydrogenase-like predicted oxidoreductase
MSERITRCELIRRLVLNSIADDYENVDQAILHDVARDGGKLGVTIERSDVVRALAELIEQGLARAYLLSSTEAPRELEGMPSLEQAEESFETYFYMTKKGRNFHRSDATWWPSNDDTSWPSDEGA